MFGKSQIENPKLKIDYATFSKKRTVYRSEHFAGFEKDPRGRSKAAGRPHLVATLDDHAGNGGPDLWRPQRQTPHSGFRYREHGRTQIGRVFADPSIQRTSGNQGRKGDED